MSTITDLWRKLDRAAYDLGKSLVKLDEMQHHGEADHQRTLTEVRTRLAETRALLAEIEAIDGVQDEQIPGTQTTSR